jgi:hypothetical protein
MKQMKMWVNTGMSKLVVIAVSVGLTAAVLAACNGGDEAVDGVVIQVRAAQGVDLTTEIDQLVLAMAAFDGEQYCGPDTYSIAIEDAKALKDGVLEMAVYTGRRFNRQVFVRIEGYRDGVLRYRTEQAASLAGGEVSISVIVSEACLEAVIGERQHCSGESVVASPFWNVFVETADATTCGEWVE